MSKSMQRQSLLGSKYFEHFNDEGKKVGESRERAGVFGKYIEHCDATGKKVGESRERAGLFGRFVEHTDATGRKTGKSVKRRSLFGDYTEHRDTSGQVVGKSKPVHNITGLGLKHTGAGWFPGAAGMSGGAGEVTHAAAVQAAPAEPPFGDRAIPLKLRLVLIAMLFAAGLFVALRTGFFR
ncbi:MAG: hypothetical protein ABI605_09505 [Rhizobacter sp.]